MTKTFENNVIVILLIREKKQYSFSLNSMSINENYFIIVNMLRLPMYCQRNQKLF